MQSSIVLALRGRTRGDDPKAVGLKQHAENVPKSLVVLDQEDDMHRIGHVDILIDHSEIRPEDAKRAVKYNTRRRGACSNMPGPDGKYLRLLVFRQAGRCA